MVRTKVFVGNLSFKTQERDLAKEFEIAGKVASANIITRGSRSLGYGFVEMESEEEARKAVELLNKKLIDEREINVEVARPRDETQKPAAPAANGSGSPANAGREGAARGSRRPMGGQRRRFRRRPEGSSPNPSAEGSNNNNNNNNNAAAPAPEGDRPPRRRPQRAPKTDAERAPRTPSQTTLFVTNLPFSVDDAGLAKVFGSFNVKSAHVVRKHNDRSKGFGFVEFNSQEDQQKALASMDKQQVEGRDIVVRVALTSADGAVVPDTAAASIPAVNA